MTSRPNGYLPSFGNSQGFKSFENLVALANAQERWNLRDTRKLVWRDTGDPPVLLETLSECIKHGTQGGLREHHPAKMILHDF